MNNFLHDFRQAARSLRKSPGFLLAAVLVLALGIGANTAIFSVVHAVLIRPLPYREANRVVALWHTPPQKAFPGFTRFAVSPANFFDWAAMNTTFEQMTLFRFSSANLTGVDRAESLTGSRVSINFFQVLGVEPMLGRAFAPGEDEPGRNHEIILSHSLWRERFGSDKSIVGRNIQLDGEPFTVIGVMGPNFGLPDFAQYWIPFSLTPAQKAVRSNHNMFAAGRLKPGVSLQQANADLAAISQKLAQAYPADNAGWGAFASPIREESTGNIRKPLLVLLAAVTFVLLIACANVANLLLARTLARKHEIAVRVALGATRRRLLQHVLSESVTVALIGGAFGLILAKFGIALITAFLGQNLPRGIEVGIDLPVLFFTLAVSVATGILSGLLPALRLSGGDAGEALKQASARTGTETGSSRTRSALVVAEVALSLTLLVGAGLMVRTLWNLKHTDAGFDTRHTLSMTLAVSGNRYKSLPDQAQAIEQLLDTIRAVPGVTEAGVVDDLPLTGGSHQPVQAEGHPVVQMSEQPEVDVRVVSPGYFRSMGISLLQGRELAATDNAAAPGAVLISASLARQLWPNESAIGKRITLSMFPGRVRQVVGIVGDVKQNAIAANTPTPTLYQPLAQTEWPAEQPFRGFTMWLVVRTSGTPAAVTPSVLAAIRRVEPQLPLVNVASLDDFVSETLTSERMNMALLVAFAGLALTLAAVGIYSVLAYNVRRRMREIGIRMALGARVDDIVRLVFVQGMKPVSVGLVIGLALSLALGRIVASMVYGVRPGDIVTLTAGSLVLLLVAIVASLLPAYRATRIVPVRVLRDE